MLIGTPQVYKKWLWITLHQTLRKGTLVYVRFRFTKDKVPLRRLFTNKQKGTNCREGCQWQRGTHHFTRERQQGGGGGNPRKEKQQACKAIKEPTVLPDECLPCLPLDHSGKIKIPIERERLIYPTEWWSPMAGRVGPEGAWPMCNFSSDSMTREQDGRWSAPRGSHFYLFSLFCGIVLGRKRKLGVNAAVLELVEMGPTFLNLPLQSDCSLQDSLAVQLHTTFSPSPRN